MRLAVLIGTAFLTTTRDLLEIGTCDIVQYFSCMLFVFIRLLYPTRTAVVCMNREFSVSILNLLDILENNCVVLFLFYFYTDRHNCFIDWRALFRNCVRYNHGGFVIFIDPFFFLFFFFIRWMYVRRTRCDSNT